MVGLALHHCVHSRRLRFAGGSGASRFQFGQHRVHSEGPNGDGDPADIAVTPLANVARLVGELALPELHGDGRRSGCPAGGNSTQRAAKVVHKCLLATEEGGSE